MTPETNDDIFSKPPIAARVLFVDDDLTQLFLLKRLGSKFISDVRIAQNGQEALRTWREWKPDVVVTDIHMPSMNGLELSIAIKAEDPEAQIVVLTSDFGDDSLIQALQAGVERYITKPVDIHLLADAITKCLRNRRQIHELQLTREIAALNVALQREKAEHLALIERFEESQNQPPQSKEMTSTGYLATDVTHEINHSVDFIHSNLDSLKKYVERLFKVLAVYEQHARELTPKNRVTFGTLREEIDLLVLQKDLTSLVGESLSRLERVKKVLQNL